MKQRKCQTRWKDDGVEVVHGDGIRKMVMHLGRVEFGMGGLKGVNAITYIYVIAFRLLQSSSF